MLLDGSSREVLRGFRLQGLGGSSQYYSRAAAVVAVVVGEVVLVTHSNKYYMGSQTPKLTCPEAFNGHGFSAWDLTVPKSGQAPPSPESLVLYEFKLTPYKIETLNPKT